MLEFLFVTMATFTMVLFVLGLLPFTPPTRLMPALVSGAGYGCMELYGRWPHYVEAAAVAGGVALIFRLAVSEGPQPWSWDDFLGWFWEHMPRPRPKIRDVTLPGRGRRIPRL